MDFTRQSAHSPQAVRPTNVGTTETGTEKNTRKPKKDTDLLAKLVRYSSVTLLFTATVLIVALAFLVYYGTDKQSKYINTSKYQAVFLNDNSSSGQSVYFGHISRLTGGYLVLQNVYYITNPSTSPTNSSSSNANYQLTKLGCQQLHDPYDQMVINMNQVAFWENLQDSGKVVQTIQQFQKNNPNGPDCNQTTNTTSQSSTQPTSSTSNASSNSTTTTSGATSTTTPSTTTTTTTPTTSNSSTSTTKNP